jgi:hypothetical protein
MLSSNFQFPPTSFWSTDVWYFLLPVSEPKILLLAKIDQEWPQEEMCFVFSLYVLGKSEQRPDQKVFKLS